MSNTTDELRTLAEVRAKLLLPRDAVFEEYCAQVMIPEMVPYLAQARSEQVVRLQQQLDLALAALKPFAAFGAAHNGYGASTHIWKSHPEFSIATFDGIEVTAGDFQRAAAALEAIEKVGAK